MPQWAGLGGCRDPGAWGWARGPALTKGARRCQTLEKQPFGRGTGCIRRAVPPCLVPEAWLPLPEKGGRYVGGSPVRSLGGGREGRVGPGHEHIWSCPPVNGDQFLAAPPWPCSSKSCHLFTLSAHQSWLAVLDRDPQAEVEQPARGACRVSVLVPWCPC